MNHFKVFTLAFLLLNTHLCLSSEVSFKKDGKTLYTLMLSETQARFLTIGKQKLSSKKIPLHNVWRGYQKTYVGYELYTLLDSVYGKEWKNKAKRVNFIALDGYRQSVTIEKMLKASKNKTGLLSYKEDDNNGFTSFKRGSKTINPGPFYLVWSNFTQEDKVKHKDALKWPYQLKAIDLKY